MVLPAGVISLGNASLHTKIRQPAGIMQRPIEASVPDPPGPGESVQQGGSQASAQHQSHRRCAGGQRCAGFRPHCHRPSVDSVAVTGYSDSSQSRSDAILGGWFQGPCSCQACQASEPSGRDAVKATTFRPMQWACGVGACGGDVRVCQETIARRAHTRTRMRGIATSPMAPSTLAGPAWPVGEDGPARPPGTVGLARRWRSRGG